MEDGFQFVEHAQRSINKDRPAHERRVIVYAIIVYAMIQAANSVFSVPPSLYPSAPLSLCPSVPPSLCPSVPLSLCPSVPPSLYPSVPLSLRPSAPPWSIFIPMQFLTKPAIQLNPQQFP